MAVDNIQDIVKWVESNPLVVTLTSGGAIVWLFANLRGMIHAVVSAVKACVSFTVTNIYEDSRGTGCGYSLKIRQIVFNNFLASTKAIWERTVNLDLSSSIDMRAFEKDFDATSSYEANYYSYCDGNGSEGIKASSKAVNTYGFSIRWMFKRICFVERSYKLDGQRITMTTNIRVLFSRKKTFMKQLEDAINSKVIEALRASASSQYVIVRNGDSFTGQKMKRSLDSIFTEDDAHKKLYDSIASFINNKDIYKKLNYPYNYCGLLYGVPGSGKTSTILAIASELKRDVQYINMSQVNSSQLLKALNDNPMGSIYVFEDIDAVSCKGASTRDKDNCSDSNDNSIAKAFGVSLSDLLNVTDGLLASDGTICLFTTNHVEKLDPAFLRAGRMNMSIEFKYMTPDVSKRMVDAYLDAPADIAMKDNIKPAELQECILDILLKKKTIDDLKTAFCE